MTIEEQKKYLDGRLELERLCCSEQNKKEILEFEQAGRVSNIADYLKSSAWKEDEAGDTKVYLVKDKNQNKIVAYFALNCGIIYSDFEGISLKEEEKEPFNRLVLAQQMVYRRDLSEKQKDQAKKELADAWESIYQAVEKAEKHNRYDSEQVSEKVSAKVSAKVSDRVSTLISKAENKAASKENDRELFSDTEEKEHTTNVHRTFPAIDIKFFCKNKHYNPGIKLDFKIGVYIFWELLVPHLLKVAELVGCKYIYLFAADNSDRSTSRIKEPPMYTEDYDPYADDEEYENSKVVKKLVEYYQNELKFSYVTEYKILKPHYERMCFTLIQEVNKLEENRKSIWEAHASSEI